MFQTILAKASFALTRNPREHSLVNIFVLTVTHVSGFSAGFCQRCERQVGRAPLRLHLAMLSLSPAGRGMVSYHAHNGPVKFLVAATTAPTADKDKPRDSPPPGADPQDEDQKEAAPIEGARPCLSPGSPEAVWLGASLGCAVHSSELSSASGSLEPRPEDSVVCDLLRHPSTRLGPRRQARTARASSVLVACGGQGHRRVGRRARQPRPEELASSIMVWQIPLLHV